MSTQTASKETGIIAWFVRNTVSANLLMVIILILGLIALLSVRIEGWPPFMPNLVSVSVVFEAGSAEEQEQAVAIKIEESLNGLAGVKNIWSDINAQSTVTYVIGQAGYPVNDLKEDIKTRVESIDNLPSSAERPSIDQVKETNHVLSIEVFGEVEHSVLRQQALRLRDQFLAIDGIDKITLNGERKPEISIDIKQAVLQRYQFSIEEVAQAIRQQSIKQNAGYLETDSNIIRLYSDEQAHQIRELENMPLMLGETQHAGILRLKDIADIRNTYEEVNSISRFQGQPSIQMNVELLGDGSITKIANIINTRINSLQAEGVLPTGIHISSWNDESVSIADRLRLMKDNGLIGILLVFLILALFLDMRIAMWVAVGIPVSFAGALAMMSPEIFNLSINQLTTFGFIIVLGIVVDDAIIIGESIHHAKTEDDTDPIQATIRGASMVAMPATFGVLTTVAAFLPLVMIEGELGKYFAQIVLVVIACLFFSLIESKLILPAHLAHVRVDKKPKNYILKLIDAIRRRVDVYLKALIQSYYRPLLQGLIAHRYNSLCGFVAIFLLIVSLIPAGIVKSDLFPDLEDDYIGMTLDMRSGMNTADFADATKSIEKKLLEANQVFQEKKSMDQSPVVNTRVTARNLSQLAIHAQITSGSERTYSKQDLMQQWREALTDMADIKSTRFEENDDSDIYIGLLGNDFIQLNAAAEKIKQAIINYDGVEDVRSSFEGGEVTLKVERLPAAYQLGLSQQDITIQLHNALSGYEVQRIQRDGDDVSVIIRLPRNERDQVYDLHAMHIKTPAGELVSLDAVVKLTQEKSLSQISRYKKNRAVLVFGNINEQLAAEDINSKIEDITSTILEDFPGVSIHLAGNAEEEGKLIKSLLKGFILGLLLIYALLAIPLKSYIEPIVIMIAIPFGIIGAIIGHYIVGLPFTLLSFFGVLALSGVVVNDALILTSRYNQFRQTSADAISAVVDAGAFRFRAILLTSITTFAGLAPLLLETSEQAQIIVPMAVSLGFGVMFATGVTLLIIPVLLIIREDVMRVLETE